MARPALIIGLGGTGQWVLTYVKKELLDYTKGQGMPKEVRLVAFDTARPLEEKKRKPDEEEPIIVEGVRLDMNEGEFHHLGGNIYNYVREIANENKHPHIASWLQAKTYIARLGAGQYDLEEGAGQMRPFGRMAVYKDLEANPQASRIFGTLHDAITDIRSEVKEERSLEISIIASLAGGTGAGMAIDVAHIARTIAEDVIGTNFVIRGFFILPRAFKRSFASGDNPSMRARAFAAIRELGRFLTVFGNRKYPMIYNPHPAFKDELQRPVEKRLFDLCYLIDAQRDRNSLDATEAKHGVFPSIADAILAFLDDSSGQAHTEHVKNIMKELVRGDDVPYFSTLGTFSYLLPIGDISEENACELAKEFLNDLLKPELSEDRVAKLASFHNQEMPNKRGADLAESFMKDPGSVEGIRGTLFLSEVVKVYEQGGARNEQLVGQTANRSNLDWLRVIEPDDTSQEIIELRHEVRSILEHPLLRDVRSSREMKVKPEHDLERVERDVEQFFNQYLGRKQVDGTTVGGKFREALARYESLQVDRYRKGLGDFCLVLLNGTTETDPKVAKSGKLGFVVDFLQTVAQRLDGFSHFMEKVREVRTREGRLRLQREQVQAARNQMFEERKKVGVFQKAGYSSQEDFLKLIEEQVEIEKDEMLFEYVNRIGRALREHSIALQDMVNSWVKTLAMSTPEQMSLYEAVNVADQQVKARRKSAKNFAMVRREETDGEFEQRLYKRFADDQLRAMFRSVKWGMDPNGKELTFGVLGKALMHEKRRASDRPTEYNTRLLLNETRRAFQSLAERESIGNRLMENKPEDLADQLFINGSPLMKFKERPRFAQAANFLTVKHRIVDGDEPYFREVVRNLGTRSGAKEQQAQLVQSEGAQKCTLVYTLDVVNAESVTAYDDLYDAYRLYTDDRRLLHNFPAEVNAVDYEQRLLDKLQLPYRMFNPRIVFMLEHRDWVRLFTMCMIYELVKTDKDQAGKPFHILNLPACEYAGKKFNAGAIELSEHVTGRPDLQQAMDTFVFRQKDYRITLERPIQFDQVTGALILAEKNAGDAAANINKIEAVINSGFIHNFKNSEKPFERDLGDLMHLMLLDELDRLSVS